MSTTCKFFLQGTCKFGDNCKFSHQINDTIPSQETSVMRQQIKPPTIDTNLLIRSVITDMNNAEKGGHWLLSSYAPFKDKPWFPGFENRSFEEVRYGYYEAMKSGTVEQYKLQLQSALQEAAMKMKVLQNPTNEIVSMLIQIYNTPVNNQFTTVGVLPTSQPNTTFIQNQPNPSIFAVANQKLFGNTPNQQQSIFAGSQTNASNIFLGNQAGTNSMFNSTLPQTVNKSIFSGGQTVIGNQPTFGPNQNLMLGNQTFENHSLQSQSPFISQSQNTVFATPNNYNQPSNTFISQIQNSPFAVPTNTNSPFNQGQSPTSSIFHPQNQQTNYSNMITPNPLPSFTGQLQQSTFPTSPSQPSTFPISPAQQSTFPTSPSQHPTSPFLQQPNNPGNNLFNVQIPTTVFAEQNSIFGNQIPAATEQKLTNSIFAQTTHPLPTEQKLTNSIFAQTAQPLLTEQKLTNSIFAQTPMTNSVFGGTPEINSEAYSKLEDLSESDIKSFQSDTFEFGKIPEKPPTAQMCL